MSQVSTTSRNDIPARNEARTPAMDEGSRDFIEKFGLIVESVGWLPRMTARLFGCLLVAAEPLTQAQLREILGASLGSVSASSRDLLSKRIAERVNIPGSRQTGLQLHPDPWRILEEDGLRTAQDYARLASQTHETLGAANPAAAENMKRMRDYFTTVEEHGVAIIAWLEANRRSTE